MKHRIFVWALAALALTGCHTKSWYEKDGIPVEPEPEPVITYEGEGKLVRLNKDNKVQETNHTYSWKADETTIKIEAWVDGSQYVNGDDTFNGGEFSIGWFTLPHLSINEFLGGIDVKTDLDASTFYGVEPDGTKVDFTSFAPGMWVAADGTSCNWGDGRAYWQWYIWGKEDGGGYDMNANDYPDIVYLGSNPGNVKDVLGKDVTSRAKIDVNGVTYDWIVTLHFGEAEKVETGSGVLKYHNWTSDSEYEIAETSSKYTWTVHQTEGISINVEVNTEEWKAREGDFEIGFIPDLTQELVSSVLGFDPGTLDDTAFYPLNPDGSKVAWSSYAPGMWIDASGASSDWMAGNAYWQWYVRKDQDYDYKYEDFPYIVMIGGNPGNTSKIEFDKEIVSKAVMVNNGNEYPFTVTYVFHEVILPESEGYPEAVFEGSGTPYPYGGGVDRNHTINWSFSETGLTVDVDAYIPQIIEDDVWVFTACTIPTEVMTAYLGIDDIEKLFDLEYFYPLNADGTPSGNWTSYEPGEWVDADGNATTWDKGHMYWWYQWGEHKYESHFTEGLFLIGTNPGNVQAGETVVSKAQLGDKLLTVKVHFFDEYPTAKTGKVGPHSYSWELTDDGVEIVAEASSAAKDDSWAWMGFFVNENYINAKYGYNLSELAADFENGFYPVANDGTTKLEKWTSYIPGMWFGEDGNAGGWAFWQYYTFNYNDVGYHDFQAPGLVYVGKNPGNEYTPGTSVTSKAIAGGKAFNVTLTITE